MFRPIGAVGNHSLLWLCTHDLQVLSNTSGLCLEGMLGPQRSFMATNPCAVNKTNVKQLWYINKGGRGTVAAYDHDNATTSSSTPTRGQLATMAQCLTAFNGSSVPSTCDIFAGPLVGSQYAVAVFNHATTNAATVLNLTSILPYGPGVRVHVAEVFTGSSLGEHVDSLNVTTPPHGTSFMIMSRA